jgi:hypothetical protein
MYEGVDFSSSLSSPSSTRDQSRTQKIRQLRPQEPISVEKGYTKMDDP